MKVSVVIPLFNKRRHIQRAIDSVLAQSVSDFELVVVNDGSTDGGDYLVSTIKDPRVRLTAQSNAGVGAARNCGVQQASSELVAFLDADDEWSPDFLKTVIGLYRRFPEAGMFATAYRFSHGRRTWHPHFVDCPDRPHGDLLPDYFSSAIGPAPVSASSVMIPKQVFHRTGLFPIEFSRGEDLHMWARIALRYRVAWSPVVCAIYHLSADNRACDLAVTTADMAAAPAIEEFLQSGHVPISSRSMVEEYLVSRRLPIALDCHLNGKRSWSLRLLEKTHDTRMFKYKRLAVQCAVWIPPCILTSVLSMKECLRRMLSWCKRRPMSHA